MSMDNLSLSDIASVTRGNDGFGDGNMGFFWIFALLLLAGGGFGNGFGNNGNALSQNDLQRAIDLNSIQQGQAGISADIQRGIYEINSSTKDASYNNLGEIRDVQASIATGFANQQTCCCETKQAIIENRYADAQNTSAIQASIAQSDANTTAQIQKIMDKLNEDKIASLEAQIQNLNLQNAVSNVVRYPTSSTWAMSGNPFCGCSGGAF